MSSSGTPVRAAFAGHALLVSNNRIETQQIVRAMQRFAFNVDVCPDLGSASRLIAMRKFQAIVLDEGLDQRISSLFDVIHSSPSNRSAVTFGVVGVNNRSGPQIYPNFLLHRPLTSALLASTLKAAMGSIIRDYRRYFRYPLRVQATIRIGDGPAIGCELINISEGGVALGDCIPLELGHSVSCRFALPDTIGEFQVDAKVCWSDKRSHAGLHFDNISQEQKRCLQTWLSKRIEDGFPEPILQLFRKQPLNRI
ncbi:MAG TPA: PilZ domain-containing protein [Terracidiphilus sp.]|jgi:hypothetical protein